MLASRPIRAALGLGKAPQHSHLVNLLRHLSVLNTAARRSCAGAAKVSEAQTSSKVTLSHDEIPQQIIIQDNFMEIAGDLRAHFTSRFADPLHASGERFVWDYWHVPDQYTLLRTPADQFFPEESYQQLEDALLEYGEEQLGCRGISPIWLSYYVDGCRQELHADSPHGPWAFVLSLTDWEHRGFTGGETVIFKPHMLDFWSSFEPARGFEFKDMVSLVQPHFNRLTVFDGRYPHGVRPVEGTRDPLKARLVLHGWFTEPTPFFDGLVDEGAAVEALNAVLEEFYEALEAREFPTMFGTLVIRVVVDGGSGRVKEMRCLTDTLVQVPAEQDYELLDRGRTVRQEIFVLVRQHVSGLTFPEAAGALISLHQRKGITRIAPSNCSVE